MVYDGVFDVLIIGLGPAGIMATYYLQEHGIKVLAVDRGKPYSDRDQACSYDVANGFGGAGLFSDGKLSFFPAASVLWANANKSNLKKSYGIMQSILTPLGYKFPKWQNGWTVLKPNAHSTKRVKRYKTTYFDERARIFFVENMFRCIQSVALLNTEVVHVVKCNGKFSVTVKQSDATCYVISAKRIVLATGKAGNTLLELFKGIKFQCDVRFEAGIRIETNSENFRPFDLKQIDYKYIEQIGDIEFRTFCSCKDGQVLQSNYLRNISYNGSITPYRTGRSNIGLTIRTNNAENEIAQELISCVNRHDSFVFDFGEDYDSQKKFWIGTKFDSLIAERLNIVLKSNKYKYKTKVYGPEIEYFDQYPRFNWTTLQVDDENIWVVGDLSGKYRGIVAALLSGIYTANHITDNIGLQKI